MPPRENGDQVATKTKASRLAIPALAGDIVYRITNQLGLRSSSISKT